MPISDPEQLKKAIDDVPGASDGIALAIIERLRAFEIRIPRAIDLGPKRPTIASLIDNAATGEPIDGHLVQALARGPLLTKIAVATIAEQLRTEIFEAIREASPEPWGDDLTDDWDKIAATLAAAIIAHATQAAA